MIAEIELDNIIKKDVYEKLKDVLDLQPTDKRISKDRYSGAPRIMAAEDYYEDEVTEKDGAYYDKNNLEKEVGNYYIYTRVTGAYVNIGNTKHLVDMNDISRKFPWLTYKVLRTVPIEDNSVSSLAATIAKLEDKINTLSNTNFAMNAKCNVHVAGFGLISIKKVTYETDMCTDELQKMLNDGWRIIACCVQPDQRRPDYIFGKMEIPE